MSLLDRITTFHGRLSDLRIIWWPFLFLKPESPATLITWRRRAIMIPCFAAWGLVGWLVRAAIVGEFYRFAPGELVRSFFIMALVFTLWFNLVTAPLWNRRARSIATSPSD